MDKRFGLNAHCIIDIVGVLKLQPEVEEAIIFGSRAMGTFKNGSDIDIALKGGKITFDTISSIRLRLDELPYLYMYDIVDYHKISNPAVTAHIDEIGITFYKKLAMPNEWKTYRLSDIINLVGGGTPKTTIPEYWNGDIPWLSVVDFGKSTKTVYSTEKTITEKGLTESSTRILKKGQLIISARGTVGELAVLGRDMAFNQSCYGLYAKEATTNDFLYYLVKDSVGKIKQNTHGAVFDTITKQTFENIEVSVPDLATQTQIAQILSSLDDKIELNLQMNQTLEAMAQALFKEWFVDFNFPGFDGVLVDGLPKGWSYKTIKDIGKVVTGNTPSSKNPEYFGELIPFVTPTDFKNFSKIIVSANRYLSDEGSKSMKTRLLPKHSIIVTCIGSDMGKVAINGIECITNQQINSVIPVDRSYVDYLYHDLIYKYDYLRNIATGGSTMPIINKSRFEEIEILMPSSSILRSFQDLMDSFNCKLEENIRQSESLTATRDALLPKLMSGQIEIKL